MVKIYKLIDPVSHLPIYVGQTDGNLQSRLEAHKSESKNLVFSLYRSQLKKQGLKLTIELIKEVPINDAHKEESYWVNQYHTVNGNKSGENLCLKYFSKDQLIERLKDWHGERPIVPREEASEGIYG